MKLRSANPREEKLQADVDRAVKAARLSPERTTDAILSYLASNWIADGRMPKDVWMAAASNVWDAFLEKEKPS